MLWFMDVFSAIENRRSIKPLDLSDAPVPRDLIQKVLDAANWAPSHRHTEPWRFKVYLGDARIRLAEAVASTLPAAESSKATTTIKKMTHASCLMKVLTFTRSPKARSKCSGFLRGLNIPGEETSSV